MKVAEWLFLKVLAAIVFILIGVLQIFGAVLHAGLWLLSLTGLKLFQPVSDEHIQLTPYE